MRNCIAIDCPSCKSVSVERTTRMIRTDSGGTVFNLMCKSCWLDFHVIVSRHRYRQQPTDAIEPAAAGDCPPNK